MGRINIGALSPIGCSVDGKTVPERKNIMEECVKNPKEKGGNVCKSGSITARATYVMVVALLIGASSVYIA